MDKKQNIIVVGAGASGLMAAGFASSKQNRVILIEKMNKPAIKLSITGKGRCNLTNTASLRDMLHSFGDAKKFLRPAISSFPPTDLIAFFEKIGVETCVERGGRVFPKSGKAKDVVYALINWTKLKKIELITDARITKIQTQDSKTSGVQFIKKNGEKEIFKSNAVIIATGGLSYPLTGSTGCGYTLAKELGHSILDLRPSLVPLETDNPIIKSLQGLSLKNVSASLWWDGKKQKSEFGEMLFTHFGVSGPIILTLSKFAVDALKIKKKIILGIDFKPALDDKKLDKRLLRTFEEHKQKSLKNILQTLLPQKLIPAFIEVLKLNHEKKGIEMTKLDRKNLRKLLKNFSFKISGHRPIKEAIITAGGIDLKEVNSKTMESKIVSGLFFCGEVLDIDAETGGYNLQAAFSTGFLAGKSASEKKI